METGTQGISLGKALQEMVRHPLGLLVDWNWKAALFSAMIRGTIFFSTNLRAGGMRRCAQRWWSWCMRRWPQALPGR